VPSRAEGGVLGILPGTVALVQATETLKLLTGLGVSLVGRLLHYDALDMEWREFKMKRDPECPICGDTPTITALIDYEGFCGMPAREGTAEGELVQTRAADLARRREAGEAIFLLDVRGEDERETATIEGSHWIPLDELEARIGEMVPAKGGSIVVHCHHGGRSEKAARLLLDRGFSGVENLDGGIESWSLTVDPAVPRY
jgi:adenylyltransferase/sulfurtransferase